MLTTGDVPSATRPAASLPTLLTRFLKTAATHAFVVGLSIRVILMVLLPVFLDDGVLLKGVKYTDIDYDVFTDAADHVAEGRSPYERHTYRYTPFLAAILAWRSNDKRRTTEEPTRMLWYRMLCLWREKRYFGRLLFCISDSVCGYTIVYLRRKARTKLNDQRKDFKKDPSKSLSFTLPVELQDALWWQYNPLPINICTRGSAESFVVLLPVLVTLAVTLWTPPLVTGTDKTKGLERIHSTTHGIGRSQNWAGSQIAMRAALAGIMHGIAVHAKLYPIIYTVSFMANFSFQQHSASSRQATQTVLDSEPLCGTWKHPTSTRNEKQVHPVAQSASYRRVLLSWLQPKCLIQFLKLWVCRLIFTSSSMIFFLAFIATFSSVTYWGAHLYGQKAISEGLLYHFSRVDHRHNYSIFWYWIYLARGRTAARTTTGNIGSGNNPMTTFGKISFLPQFVLVLFPSLGLAPYDLSFALFVQTFVFVAHNKVITAQYFTWYLCLLPLCSDRINWRTPRIIIALALLGLSIATWLGSAFCLEMKGMAVHTQVWVASLFFFGANTNLLGAILSNYHQGRVNKVIKNVGFEVNNHNPQKEKDQ